MMLNGMNYGWLDLREPFPGNGDPFASLLRDWDLVWRLRWRGLLGVFWWIVIGASGELNIFLNLS